MVAGEGRQTLMFWRSCNRYRDIKDQIVEFLKILWKAKEMIHLALSRFEVLDVFFWLEDMRIAHLI